MKQVPMQPKPVKLVIGQPWNIEVKGSMVEQDKGIVIKLNDWKFLVLAFALSAIPYTVFHFTVKLALNLFG